MQSVKRRVDGINTTMNECEDKIKSANRSGEHAQQKKRVSRATWHKIKRSLENMCGRFEEIYTSTTVDSRHKTVRNGAVLYGILLKLLFVHSLLVYNTIIRVAPTRASYIDGYHLAGSS